MAISKSPIAFIIIQELIANLAIINSVLFAHHNRIVLQIQQPCFWNAIFSNVIVSAFGCQQGKGNFYSDIESLNLENVAVKAFSASKCITTNFSACYLYLSLRLYPLSLTPCPLLSSNISSTSTASLSSISNSLSSLLHLLSSIWNPPPSAIQARISITSTLVSTIAYKHVLWQLRRDVEYINEL